MVLFADNRNGMPNGVPCAQAACWAIPTAQDLSDDLVDIVYVHTRMRELLQAAAVPTRRDVMNLASELLQRHTLSARRLATELATLPEPTEQIPAWLRQRFIATRGHIEQLSTMLYGIALERPLGMPDGPLS